MKERGFCIWFTGLSGSGKTTISSLVAKELKKRGYKIEVLDGDEIRTNISKGLGFSKEDRDINIRRIGWVCEVLTRNNIIAIGAAISPYRAIREEIRKNIGKFVEVFCSCPLEVLIKRDAKGLYKKAIKGEIKNFTGISDPYEEPQKPEVILYTDTETPEQCVAKIMKTLESQGFLR
jgi:adenylyl-sulfate kinase